MTDDTMLFVVSTNNIALQITMKTAQNMLFLCNGYNIICLYLGIFLPFLNYIGMLFIGFAQSIGIVKCNEIHLQSP